MAGESSKKEPSPLNIGDIGAIADLDTARMALRWALERISALQLAQGDNRYAQASEALARWEAASLEACLLRLAPIPGVEHDELLAGAEQWRRTYEEARRSLEREASPRAREVLEALGRREQGFSLWRRFIDGLTMEQDAAQQLSRQLEKKRPSPSDQPGLAQERPPQQALEDLKRQWPEAEPAQGAGPLTRRFETLLKRDPLPSIREFLWMFETWELEQFARRKAVEDLLAEREKTAGAGQVADAAAGHALEEARRQAESLKALVGAAEAEAGTWRERASQAEAALVKAREAEVLAQALGDRLRQRDEDLKKAQDAEHDVQIQLAEFRKKIEGSRAASEEQKRAETASWQVKLEAVEAQRSDLGKLVQDAERAREVARGRIAALEDEAASWRVRAEALERQRDELQKLGAESERAREVTRGRIAVLEAEAGDWRAKAEVLERQRDELQKIGAEAQAAADAARARVTAVEAEAYQWRSKADASVPPRAEFEALGREVADWRAKAEALERQKGELDLAADQARREAEDLRAHVAALEAEVLELRAKPAVSPSHEADLADALARANAAQAKAVEAAARVEELTRQLKEAAPVAPVAPAAPVAPPSLFTGGPLSEQELENLAPRLKAVAHGLRRLLMEEESHGSQHGS